jgi:hypothetical protein
MRAAVLLHDLSSRGVTLEAHGTDLLVDGPADTLSDELIEALRTLKPTLLRLLSAGGDETGWDAVVWQAYFVERAAIRELDGHLARAEAERLAYEDTITHWLCHHPALATDPRRGCVHCSGGEHVGDTLLPVLAPDGHVWVHDRCWETWHMLRREQASHVLQRLGLSSTVPRVMIEPSARPGGWIDKTP